MVWEKTKKGREMRKMWEFTEKVKRKSDREYKSKWHYLGKRIRMDPSGMIEQSQHKTQNKYKIKRKTEKIWSKSDREYKSKWHYLEKERRKRIRLDPSGLIERDLRKIRNNSKRKAKVTESGIIWDKKGEIELGRIQAGWLEESWLGFLHHTWWNLRWHNWQGTKNVEMII